MTRWPFVLAIVAWAALVCRLLVACIIADPPPSPPAVPSSPPSIVQMSVVPPPGVFATWPPEFEILISNPSPPQAFSYALYVDYSPTGATGNGSQYQGNMPLGTVADGGYQVVAVAVSPPDAGGCHTVQFLIGPPQSTGFLLPQTATDSVPWTYEPEGTCSPFDGAAFDDAAIPPMQEENNRPIVGDK